MPRKIFLAVLLSIFLAAMPVVAAAEEPAALGQDVAPEVEASAEIESSAPSSTLDLAVADDSETEVAVEKAKSSAVTSSKPVVKQIPGAGNCKPDDLPELSEAGMCKGIGVGLRAGIFAFRGFISASTFTGSTYDPNFAQTISDVDGFYALMRGGVCKDGVSESERLAACAGLAQMEKTVSDPAGACDPKYDGCRMILARFSDVEDTETQCSKSERAAYGVARMKAVLRCE